MDSVKIYKLTDPREPDVVRYVGMTKTKINTRLNSHIYNAKSGCKRHSSLWINNLLKNNVRPIVRLVDECAYDDWEFWEKFYIMKFNSDKLTNIESGGKSQTLRKYNKKGTSKNTKIVEQYSLNGEFISEYKSCAEAERLTGFNRHVIAATCRGNQVKAYGHKWKFKESDDFTKKKHKRSRKVYQYDLDNNLIKIYESVAEAAKETKFSYGGISGCVHNNINRCGNFKFKFND